MGHPWDCCMRQGYYPTYYENNKKHEKPFRYQEELTLLVIILLLIYGIWFHVPETMEAQLMTEPQLKLEQFKKTNSLLWSINNNDNISTPLTPERSKKTDLLLSSINDDENMNIHVTLELTLDQLQQFLKKLKL